MRARCEQGFTLLELITVMILLGILSVVLSSRLGGIGSAGVQGSRDDVIAAFSFARQLAMVRDGITLEMTATSVSVNQAGAPIAVGSNYYPLAMPANVTLVPSQAVFGFDRLGRTDAGSVTISGSGASVSIQVESTGYAYAN